MAMNIAGRREFLTAIAASLLLDGQTYVPKQSDRPEALQGDEAGFQPIFDGKTLDGWDGDPKYWRVEEGCLTGEVTPQNLLKSNTFIIWRGGSPKDFELKADYRITSGGNSGINYRSVLVPDAVTPGNRFAMRGYQADIDGPVSGATWRSHEGDRRPQADPSVVGGGSETTGVVHHTGLELLPPDHPRECAGAYAQRPRDERYD
jgi:hypothetical protein